MNMGLPHPSIMPLGHLQKTRFAWKSLVNILEFLPQTIIVATTGTSTHYGRQFLLHARSGSDCTIYCDAELSEILTYS